MRHVPKGNANYGCLTGSRILSKCEYHGLIKGPAAGWSGREVDSSRGNLVEKG